MSRSNAAAALLFRSKKNLAPGIYGSTLASTFFKDAVNGADSLDVVTIGDSNAGYSYGGFGGGGGGWTRGMLRGLNNAGAPTYGSGMAPIMHTGVTTTTQVVKEDDGSTITTIAGFARNHEAATGNLLRGGASGPAAITAIAVPATTLLPYGLTNFDYAWVAASTTYQTFGQPIFTYPGGAAPSPALPSWCAVGTAVKYRMVYSRTATSGGTINPTVYKVTGGTYTALATRADSTYSAAGTDIQASDLSFTMPTTTPASAIILGWAYIGITTGPAGALLDSIYKVAKGISVHNLHYGSGQTSTVIATAVNGCNASKTFLENYFKQIVDRQILAGGTGRVIVQINCGVNDSGSPGSSTITNAFTAMINTLKTAWAAAGYTSKNLGFLCSVSHPLNTDYGDEGVRESTLAAYRTAANTWASSVENVTVVDLSQVYTAAQMTSNGYYAGVASAEAHLSQTGYYAFGQQIVSKILASR